MDDGRSAGLVLQHIILHLVGVCQLGAQTGVAVGHLQDVLLAAQCLHDGGSVHGSVLCGRSSGAVPSSGSSLGLVLSLGVELHLHAVRLTAQRVEVQLDDQHAEDHIVQEEVQNAYANVDGPAGLANAQRQVVQQEIDKAVGADGAAAQQVQHHKAGTGQHSVHNEQDGSHEQEAELDGLGDTGDKGGDSSGDQHGLDLFAVLRTCSLVHGQASTDQTKHLGNAAGIPDDRLAQHSNGGICDLGVVDVAGTLQHLTAHSGSAAQRGVQERGVDQMVQTGGDQQTLQRAVDKQAEVACAADKAAQSVDASLCIRPHRGEQHSQNHHDRDQNDEHKTSAAVDLESVVELSLAEAVVHPCDHDAQQQADEHAHVQDLNAQNHGLTGAGKAALYQHTAHVHEFVHGIEEHQECQQRDKACLRLFLVGQAHAEAHAEDNAQIAQDGVERTGQQRAEADGDRVVQKRQHCLQPDIGEQVAHSDENTGNGQDQNGDEHCFGEPLQCIHYLILHGLTPFHLQFQKPFS